MQIISLIIKTLAIAVLFVACKPVQPTAVILPKKAAETFKIDGLLEAWQTDFRTSASLPDMRYQAIAGDEYLYVCVQTTSQAAQTRIIRLGMGVWVDTTLKQRNLMGIKFPLALTEAQEANLAARAKTQPLEKTYIELCNEFDIVGFAPEPLRATNVGSQNFKAAVGFNELGEMICEYRIPWKAIFQGRAVRWDEEFKICIRINEPPKNEQDEDPNAGGGGVLGNGITQGSNNPMANNPNGAGSGVGGNPMNTNRQVPRPTGGNKMPELWLRVKLSGL